MMCWYKLLCHCYPYIWNAFGIQSCVKIFKITKYLIKFINTQMATFYSSKAPRPQCTVTYRHHFLIKKFTQQTIKSLKFPKSSSWLVLTLGRQGPENHLQPVRSLRYLMDSNCSSLLQQHCKDQLDSVSLEILGKMEGYVTGQHFQEVHLAVSEALKSPSSDAELFETLLSDFGTIPKKIVISCWPRSTTFWPLRIWSQKIYIGGPGDDFQRRALNIIQIDTY